MQVAGIAQQNQHNGVKSLNYFVRNQFIGELSTIFRCIHNSLVYCAVMLKFLLLYCYSEFAAGHALQLYLLFAYLLL